MKKGYDLDKQLPQTQGVFPKRGDNFFFSIIFQASRRGQMTTSLDSVGSKRSLGTLAVFQSPYLCTVVFESNSLILSTAEVMLFVS